MDSDDKKKLIDLYNGDKNNQEKNESFLHLFLYVILPSAIAGICLIAGLLAIAKLF